MQELVETAVAGLQYLVDNPWAIVALAAAMGLLVYGYRQTSKN